MLTRFRDRNYRIAIAIDFGTARSGFAYQFFEDKDVREAYFRDNWPDTDQFYPKTLTEILFAPDGSIKAWGHSAKTQFTQLKETGEERGYIFIDNFKTLLHEGKDRDNDGLYIIRGDKKFYLLHLIAEFLRLIKEVALKDIADGQGGKGLFDESEIQWCLTVPAVWEEDSKQIMRRAAERAGLIGEDPDEADRLLLVLEPEAAAVHCQQVMLRQNKSDLVSAKPKTIVVVDAGGGTVDITVHEAVRGKEGLKELIPCGGGLHGSKYVDKDFRAFLDRKLSFEAMNEFQNEWPSEYIHLMSETWESLKCRYNADVSWRRSMDLPRQLEQILKNSFPQILEQLANTQGGNNTCISLTSEDMEEVFKPTIDRLIAEVSNQFNLLEARGYRCDTLFLVGGFAESPVLKNRIQQEFSSRVTEDILILERPGAAVLLGAASLGINPSFLISRCSKLTYGMEYITSFEEGLDPEEKRLPKELLSLVYQKERNYDCCNKRFDIFVAAGDKVPANVVVARQYSVSPMATELELTFLSTSDPEVRYVDEDSVREMASVKIRLPFTPQNDEIKTVQIEMEFGSSEVCAYAIDPVSGNRQRCNFRFSSGY